MQIDWIAIIISIGGVWIIYSFLKSFKADIIKKLDRMETRLDHDERIFWMSNGRNFKDIIIEEKLRRERETP